MVELILYHGGLLVEMNTINASYRNLILYNKQYLQNFSTGFQFRWTANIDRFDRFHTSYINFQLSCFLYYFSAFMLLILFFSFHASYIIFQLSCFLYYFSTFMLLILFFSFLTSYIIFQLSCFLYYFSAFMLLILLFSFHASYINASKKQSDSRAILEVLFKVMQ